MSLLSDRLRRTEAFFPGSPPATRGSTLIEVLVALVVLAIVLVPLAQTLLDLAFKAARYETSHASARELQAPGPRIGWTWGWRPGAVSWEPGPRLRVDVLGPGTNEVREIGVWVDGLMLPPASVRPGERLAIGLPTEWGVRAGAEVVVRGRATDAGWGAPWRTIVPGDVVAPATWPDSLIPAPSPLLVHLAVAGGARLVLGDTAREVVPTAVGAPIVLPPPGAGDAAIVLPSGTQSWHSEAGRSLDVYF
jgi:prepilin-type N-terminal cleavage/methylation domain-containing protein